MAVVDSLPLIAQRIAGTLIRGQLKPPTPKGWLIPPLRTPCGQPLPLFFWEEKELNDSLHEVRKMEKDDLMRLARGRDWVPEGLTLTLSNKKTYFLDAVGKRLRNVNDPYDSIDIEQLLRIREYTVQAGHQG